MNTIKNDRKGFTLLELLVVVLIIGILAGIALPQYKKAVLRSKFAAIKDKTRAIYEAEQRYYLANNQYTTKFSDLDITTTNVSSTCNISSPNSYVYCSVRKGNDTLLQYIIMTETRKLRCDAFPGDKTTLTNQICQMETGKEPKYDPCNPNFCIYYY